MLPVEAAVPADVMVVQTMVMVALASRPKDMLLAQLSMTTRSNRFGLPGLWWVRILNIGSKQLGNTRHGRIA